MEALTYDRALAFKDDIPPEEYKTWQSRKLVALLESIDPLIVTTSAISLAPEGEYGKTPPRPKVTPLGTDHVLTAADLKKNYDAIGSRLHMPSLENVLSGQLPDEARLRARCQNLIETLKTVLSSKAWNFTLGNIATLDECMNQSCKKPIRKRIQIDKDTVEATCFECNVEYTITSEQDGRSLWTPNYIHAPCSDPTCSVTNALWPHEVKPGTHWRCRGCGTHNGIELSVSKIEDDNSASK